MWIISEFIQKDMRHSLYYLFCSENNNTDTLSRSVTFALFELDIGSDRLKSVWDLLNS